jgi:hypothetical protein
MGRYLVLWEIDSSKTPVDDKERVAGWSLLTETVKQDIKSGITKDHGQFVGELSGYSVLEGTEVEVSSGLAKYAPYVIFKLHAVLSVAQVGEIIKKMSG